MSASATVSARSSNEASSGLLSIVISTSPGAGITLAEEIRLAKPALLYGDKVTLYSPTAAMLLSVGHIAELDDDGLMTFLEAVGPSLGPAAPTLFAQFRALATKRHRTRQELQALGQMKRALRQMAMEIGERYEELLEDAGAAELIPAIEAGLVEIDPIVMDEHVGDDDILIKSYMDKLKSLLVARTSYPLFDEDTGTLVRAAVGEGMFDLGATAKRRGKQAATATDYITRVPAFPGATIAEVLDIRSESPSRSCASSTVADLSREVEAAAHDEDFAAEVADLYVTEVEPVLLELREAVETNTYLRQLLGKVSSDAKTFIAGPAVLTLGLIGWTELSAVVAAGVTTGAAATAAAAEAAVAKRQGKRQRPREASCSSCTRPRSCWRPSREGHDGRSALAAHVAVDDRPLQVMVSTAGSAGTLPGYCARTRGVGRCRRGEHRQAVPAVVSDNEPDRFEPVQAPADLRVRCSQASPSLWIPAVCSNRPRPVLEFGEQLLHPDDARRSASRTSSTSCVSTNSRPAGVELTWPPPSSMKHERDEDTDVAVCGRERLDLRELLLESAE